MSRIRLGALAGLLFASSGLACSERDLATCDITERACQESVYYHVLNLRGDGYDPFGGLPPVLVISEDEYRAQLEQAQADAAAQYGPSPWDKGLDLLHFTSSSSSSTSAPVGDAGVGGDGGTTSDAGTDAGSGNSSIDDQVAHVLAFYRWTDKTITVISHPSRSGSFARQDAMITLAHELVHALQDRELKLNRDSHGFDESLAYKGLIEGDARFYENLFYMDVLRVEKRTPRVPDVLRWPQDELDYAFANFDLLGSPFFAAGYLMYPLGARYEATLYRSGGNAAVRHGYAKAPIRTVGFLLGSDGTAPPVGSGDVSDPPVVCALLPIAEETTGGDQFGAVAFYTFLRGWGVTHDVAFAAARTWTGDFLLVQAKADFSTTAVSWRIELAAAPPASIAQTLTASGELSVNASAKSLQINVTNSPSPLTWAPLSSCP